MEKQQQEMMVLAWDMGEEKAVQYNKASKSEPVAPAREKSFRLIAVYLTQESDNASQSQKTKNYRRDKKISTMMSNIVMLLSWFSGRLWVLRMLQT